MPQFQPRDPAFADRVIAAFRNQSASNRWGGELATVSPGIVEIALALTDDLSDAPSSDAPSSGAPRYSAPRTMHRSFVAALLDDACELAGLTLTSADDSITTAEYKLNFLAPAPGNVVVARAEVVRPGRTITVCRAVALADEKPVAQMLATLAVTRPGDV